MLRYVSKKRSLTDRLSLTIGLCMWSAFTKKEKLCKTSLVVVTDSCRYAFSCCREIELTTAVENFKDQIKLFSKHICLKTLKKFIILSFSFF